MRLFCEPNTHTRVYRIDGRRWHYIVDGYIYLRCGVKWKRRKQQYKILILQIKYYIYVYQTIYSQWRITISGCVWGGVGCKTKAPQRFSSLVLCKCLCQSVKRNSDEREYRTSAEVLFSRASSDEDERIHVLGIPSFVWAYKICERKHTHCFCRKIAHTCSML